MCAARSRYHPPPVYSTLEVWSGPNRKGAVVSQEKEEVSQAWDASGRLCGFKGIDVFMRQLESWRSI